LENLLYSLAYPRILEEPGNNSKGWIVSFPNYAPKAIFHATKTVTDPTVTADPIQKNILINYY
jgi:hypothetical protein